MKKKLLLMCMSVMILTACGHEHTWQEATCTEPRVCAECGETEGSASGHTWAEATCTEAKKCSVCGETEGDTLGHTWVEATYETPKTCSVCKVTEGDALSVEADKYYEDGRTSLYGLDGNEINLEIAYNNFEQAKELGRIDANFYLGLLCDDYAYPKRDYELAKSYYEACPDNPYAQISLGQLYYNGNGVGEDKKKAEEMFQTVIDNGYVEGYWGKSSIAYDAGDYEIELECYNKVLEGTEQVYIAKAMNNIGAMYQYGDGVEQDYGKALEWYEKACNFGNASAMHNIARMHYSGEGVEQDYAKALEWYEKAADLGNDMAMNNIGYMYHFGKGVEQDYIKSLEWQEKAADLGNDAAMYNIGYMYEHGEGVEQDYTKALEWYEKAAEAGDEDAPNAVARVKSLL